MIHPLLILSLITTEPNQSIINARNWVREHISTRSRLDEFGLEAWKANREFGLDCGLAERPSPAYVIRVEATVDQLSQELLDTASASNGKVQFFDNTTWTFKMKTENWWIFAGSMQEIDNLTGFDRIAIFDGVYPALTFESLSNKANKAVEQLGVPEPTQVTKVSEALLSPRAAQMNKMQYRTWTLIVVPAPGSKIEGTSGSSPRIEWISVKHPDN